MAYFFKLTKKLRLPIFVLLLNIGNFAFANQSTKQQITANKSVSQEIELAPGYGALNYPLPEIGSYGLPPLGIASDANVIDDNENPTTLYNLFNNKYVLLAFVYSSCDDVNGCPLSAHVFYKLKLKMKNDPILAQEMKMISLSFDPKNDTPMMMRHFKSNFMFAGNIGEWDFITTDSESMLSPILSAYNQDIQRIKSKNNETMEKFAHLLRVFLIDKEQQIRNIYSVAFLHADIIENDVKTLISQEDKQAVKVDVVTNESTLYSSPGDDKRGYESSSYKTNSRSLQNRKGVEAELINFIKSPPLGLPTVPIPSENPISKKKIELGRKLFYDRRLSGNSTISCAMCHIPEQGFTNNEIATAVGIEGRTVKRNAPSLYNVAYATRLFHDAREESLELQVWHPLLAKNEMGNPSFGYVLDKIRDHDDYETLFAEAFNEKGITIETLGQALASYQRTLVSADSPFDRWYYDNKSDALNESAKRGFKLFTGKAGCAGCHSINNEHALFTDNKLHNTGIGYSLKRNVLTKYEKVQLAPGVFVDVEKSLIDRVSGKKMNDLGAYEVSQNPQDRWKYKTPSLRNITLTAPYMHDGSLGSLEQVIEFYDQGGIENPLLDPLIRKLSLNDADKIDLLSFLNSLNSSNIESIVSDAFAAPIGDN